MIRTSNKNIQTGNKKEKKTSSAPDVNLKSWGVKVPCEQKGSPVYGDPVVYLFIITAYRACTSSEIVAAW